MSPVLKKLIAGFAATKAFEKVQEMRRPQQSFLRRHIGKVFLVGLAGGAATYLFRTGKLESLIGTGGGDTSSRGEYPPGPGTEPISTPSDTRAPEPAGV